LIDEDKLIALALEARKRAYCPYSDFPVGAALLATDGRVFSGCNVENASYGLAIAIACGTGACAPCGACRQVLYEFAPDLLVIMTDGEGRVRERAKLAELLPRGFGPQDLAS